MNLTRRQFLMLTLGLAAGCNAPGDKNAAFPAHPPRLVNAGPAAGYAVDGTYSRFRDAGFFLVRDGDRLIALSSYCTHRRCRLKPEKDRTFSCPCHGSTFDPHGRVTTGPAKRDLPVLPSAVNDQGDLVVAAPGY